MSTVVHVILTGIVSVIPPAAGQSDYVVRLQDARGATHKHYPSVMTVEGKISGTGLGSPDESVTLTDGLKVAAWKIDDGDIVIGSTILDGAPQASLPYVLSISHGCKGDPDCARYQTPHGKTHVHLQVTGGLLSTSNLTDVLWRFDSEAAAKARWLAQEICWSFTIDESELTMDLPGRGTVTVQPLQANGPIELRLQNTLEDDMIPSPPMAASVDHHVSLFFERSKKKPNPVPYLRAEKPTTSAPILHATHELDGDSVATRYPTAAPPPAPARATAGGAGAAIRINCPPALWDGT